MMTHLVLLLLVLLAIDVNDAAVLHVPVKKVVSTSSAVISSYLPQLKAFQRSSVYEPFRESLVDDDWEDHADIPIHNYFGFTYVGDIYLGSPPQAFTVSFSTSSGDLWVPNRKFGRNHIYNHTKSTTYKANGTWVDMDLIAGTISEDLLQLGPLQVPNVSFVEINQTKIRILFALGKYDGDFGLGFDAQSIAHTESPFHRIVNSGVLDEPVVALYIRNAEDGIITFGGVDKSHFHGDLSYMDVVNPQYWGITLDAVKAGSSTITVAGTAFIASLPYIVGPPTQIATLAKAVGAKKLPHQGFYTINCVAPAPDIVFVLNGKEFTLSVHDYIINEGSICLWAFFDVDYLPTKDYSWLLGDVFTHKFYTVLDYGTNTRKPRVGLAPAIKSP